MRRLALVAVVVALSSVAFADGPNGTVKVDSTGKTAVDPPKDPNGPIHWDPVRWQAPDGSTVSFSIDAKTGEMPALTISIDDNSTQVALKDSFRAIQLAVNAGRANQELRVTRGDPIVIARMPQHQAGRPAVTT